MFQGPLIATDGKLILTVHWDSFIHIYGTVYLFRGYCSISNSISTALPQSRTHLLDLIGWLDKAVKQAIYVVYTSKLCHL